MTGGAAAFLAANPGLRRVMDGSAAFARVREAATLQVDEERLYIVRGDALGDEEDLFVETLIRGARSKDPADPARAVYEELDDELRGVVQRRLEGPA